MMGGKFLKKNVIVLSTKYHGTNYGGTPLCSNITVEKLKKMVLQTVPHSTAFLLLLVINSCQVCESRSSISPTCVMTSVSILSKAPRTTLSSGARRTSRDRCTYTKTWTHPALRTYRGGATADPLNRYFQPSNNYNSNKFGGFEQQFRSDVRESFSM
jgi:hypothetical protein